MTQSTDAALHPDLASALDAFLASDGPLIVASDFDGVLAPLVDDPEASRMLEPSAQALSRIGAAPHITVALVSGRTIADLYRLGQPGAGTTLIGTHGAQRGHVTTAGELEHDDSSLAPEAQARLEALEDFAEALAATTRGAWIEHKPTAIVLHTRLADAHEAQRINDALRNYASDARLHAMKGHNVVEVSVLSVTKGEAVVALRNELSAAAVLYLGDDVTDETVFATQSAPDVSVKVGTGDTAADYRVESPQAVAFLLQHIADRVNPNR
ncbi:trehalose-phosphatase [Jonesia quinghaiensis]|uniref:trehalose-phosphatase n=1 Tax=Jonesia quinghaiensis TaxID=262806 RepID=UPI000423147E|nr:trehalose-phosphatase [Jonesia quinghaiensis]